MLYIVHNTVDCGSAIDSDENNLLSPEYFNKLTIRDIEFLKKLDLMGVIMYRCIHCCLRVDKDRGVI